AAVQKEEGQDGDHDRRRDGRVEQGTALPAALLLDGDAGDQGSHGLDMGLRHGGGQRGVQGRHGRFRRPGGGRGRRRGEGGGGGGGDGGAGPLGGLGLQGALDVGGQVRGPERRRERGEHRLQLLL